MKIRTFVSLGAMVLANHAVFADASYQETSQITGGAMVAPLKSMSFLSKSMKDMFAPTTTTTMVHGNQKAVVRKESIEITDLDRETLTHVDMIRKTYSVVTFAQMRQAFQNMPKQMQQAQEQAKAEQGQQPQQPKTDLKTSFDVSVKNTGVSKDVNGLTAQEQIVTLQMHVTDPNAPPSDAGNTVTYVVTTDAWIAPDPPEVKEIQDFDKRYAEKLMAGVDMSAWKDQMTRQNPGMAQLFSGKPGSADAMAQMGKEMAKLKGTRVMEVTTMGGSGNGTATAQTTAPAPSAAPSSPNPSVGGLLGSALGSSPFGGFHKKKTTPATDATPPANTTADGTATPTSATLMEMTMQKSNFSQASVPSSSFQVPAGFTQVESPAYRGH
ncbi:MAG TPA: hypothetical protein VMB49_12915 [Acidobacteriaceae bacterium]|nr:hypothetical protein [Acidobacteriaceae bacterium]